MTNLDTIVKGTKTATEALKKAIEYGFDMGYVAHAAGQDASPAKGGLFQWLDERAEPAHLVSVKPWYTALGIAYEKDLKAPIWPNCTLDTCGNMRLKCYTEQEWHENLKIISLLHMIWVMMNMKFITRMDILPSIKIFLI